MTFGDQGKGREGIFSLVLLLHDKGGDDAGLGCPERKVGPCFVAGVWAQGRAG